MRNPLVQRAEDAYAQLDRYGAPEAPIVEMLEALSDINDDLKHGRDYKQVVQPNIQKLRDLLDKLDATYALMDREAQMAAEGRKPHPAPVTIRDALIDAAAHLAGAASAYSVYATRHHSLGRPHIDALFSTRVKDFTYAAERARAALLNPALQEPKAPPVPPMPCG